MTEQQKIERWTKNDLTVINLCHLLEHDLDENVNLEDFPPAQTDMTTSARLAIWGLTDQEAEIWARKRGRFEWTVRDLVRELRDDIRSRFMRLFINPTPELFDAAVHDQAQCYRLDVDTFLAQGHDESDFTGKLRLVAKQTVYGEVCFMLDGSALNLGKLWVGIFEPFCGLFPEELIHSPKQVSNLTLILVSDDPAEQVLSRCISECLAIGAWPHIGKLRYITARLLGVVF